MIRSTSSIPSSAPALLLVALSACGTEHYAPLPTGESGGNYPGQSQPGECPHGCTTLATDVVPPLFLSLDESAVYWSTAGGKRVGRVAKAGSAPPSFLEAPSLTTFLTVDESSAYWTSGEASGVWKAPKLGGDAVTFVPPEPQAPTEGYYGIVNDDVNIHVASYVTGKVLRVEKESGAVTVLHDELDQAPFYLGSDESSLYWTTNSAGMPNEIDRIDKQGEGFVTLFSGSAVPGPIAVDGTHVYWLNQSDCALSRVPKGGGAVEILRPGEENNHCQGQIAVDDAHVYWTRQTFEPPLAKGEAGLFRMPKSGGEREVIFEGGSPHGLVLDETHVYWSDASRLSVVKSPK